MANFYKINWIRLNVTYGNKLENDMINLNLWDFFVSFLSVFGNTNTLLMKEITQENLVVKIFVRNFFK